jgi:hypothetical protein
VYGDQRGNEIAGLPGNLYRGQFLLAQRLLRSLDAGRRNQALLEEAPVQTQIELQGRQGSFPGIAVAELGLDGKALARELVEHIFSTYPPDDVTYARECPQANGGPNARFAITARRGRRDSRRPGLSARRACRSLYSAVSNVHRLSSMSPWMAMRRFRLRARINPAWLTTPVKSPSRRRCA